MSCPDWPVMAAHRYEPEGRPPSGWKEAVEHLSTCRACHVAALVADPTLVFHAASDALAEPEEVEAVRSAVRVMRRTGAVRSALRRSLRRSGQVAALLLLAATAVLWIYRGEWRAGTEPLATAMPEEAMSFGDFRIPASDLPAAPMIELLDRPQARIYQLGQDDLVLAMIVDESLDV